MAMAAALREQAAAGVSDAPGRSRLADARWLVHPGGVSDAAGASPAPDPVRSWVGLAIWSLVLAGVMAVALVAGRVPPLSELFTSPEVFKRFLVVHVDLSLVVWFSAFVAGAGVLACGRAHARLAVLGCRVAAAGVVVLGLCAALPGGQPVLSNYVPAIDSPIFTAALALLGLGLVVACGATLAGRPESPALPEGAPQLMRGALLITIVAITTFAASFATTPAYLPPPVLWELRAWGGGHVLQVASLSAMLAAWVALVGRTTGRSPLGPRSGAVLAALLAAPTLAGPVLALAGTTTPAYEPAFTQLMRWGTWPIALVVLVACVREVARARRRRDARPDRGLRDARLLAVGASMTLCVTGFVLGALIRGSSTLVPGHYHASIGAVTCAFMALALEMAPELGLRPIARRTAAALQPPIFAVGQLVFAIGFSIAGAAGMGRKVYGAEQAVDAGAQHVGLAVMGLGGALAVAGGLLFLALVVPAFRRPRAVVVSPLLPVVVPGALSGASLRGAP